MNCNDLGHDRGLIIDFLADSDEIGLYFADPIDEIPYIRDLRTYRKFK